MDPDSIKDAADAQCSGVKNCEKCCNNRLCKNVFQRTDVLRDIRDLRSRIWETRSESTPYAEVTTGVRKHNLRREIERHLKKETASDGSDVTVLRFRINDINVCKSFFKVSLILQ